jgi:hypothetical protein
MTIFPISGLSLDERYLLQLLLVAVMFVALFFIYRIEEK